MAAERPAPQRALWSSSSTGGGVELIQSELGSKTKILNFRGKNFLPKVCMFFFGRRAQDNEWSSIFFFLQVSIVVESLSVIIRDSQLHHIGTSDGVSAAMAGGRSIPIA